MNSTVLPAPVRRAASVAVVMALAAAPVAVGATTPAAAATPDKGSASAVVLRTGLDVSLLNRTVQVPLALSLNEVVAPAGAEKTALTATLDGVDHGRPFSVLRADVASAKATVEDGKAEGRTRLARARVHVPGLPLLSVVEVGAVTSRATCEAGKPPVADANLLGSVTVLGKKVTVSAGGTTRVAVPGVGEVRLDIAKKETTSRTAAAAALELKVSVNPLELNVAEVEGTVTLGGAECSSPDAPAAHKPEPAEPDPAGHEPAAEVKPQTERLPEKDLAETGGGGSSPYLVAGALTLMVVGGGGIALARRGRN